jgi:hypothetical protein
MISNLRPNADFCIGRDTIVDRLQASLRDTPAALLFGGRLSGKTTILLRLAQQLLHHSNAIDANSDILLPVYVDLLSLPHSAEPSDFFRLMSRRAAESCRLLLPQIDIRQLPSSEGRMDALSAFHADMTFLATANKREVRFLFLLDEAKRVVGERFPRGVQDNLFSILFGTKMDLQPDIAMIFSGAQDLYVFSQDETSPLGSRASRHFVTNLDVNSVAKILETFTSSLPTAEMGQKAQLIHLYTGGHAGLCRLLCGALSQRNSLGESIETLTDLIPKIGEEFSAVVRVWNASFSPEAAVVRDMLFQSEATTLREAASQLGMNGLDRFSADRAFEELRFTGVATGTSDGVTRANKIFWDYLDQFGDVIAASAQEKSVWALIEELELALRELVRRVYQRAWPSSWLQEMQGHLGTRSWNKILANLEKSRKSYPLSQSKQNKDAVDCMYIGQLEILMITAAAWPLFQSSFQDKRQVNDLFRAIIPVRNDHAHFSPVPDKELLRCRLACDDLLFLVGKIP